MDHVFHIGEIYQVLSIPAQTKGRSLALRQVRLKICLWHKEGLSHKIYLFQVSSSPALLCCNFRLYPVRETKLLHIISETEERLLLSQLLPRPSKFTLLQQYRF